MHLPFMFRNQVIAGMFAVVFLSGCGAREVKPIELVRPLDLAACEFSVDQHVLIGAGTSKFALIANTNVNQT
jgi:hypothetical protein